MTTGQTDILHKGDIRRVRPHLAQDAEARMALIVRDRDDGSDLVEIMLAHERPDMAGPCDVILQPDTAQLPHGLVVQTFVRGCIWRTQCFDLVVRLTPDEMRSVRETVSARIRRSRDSCQELQEQELSPEQEAFLESEHEAYRNLIADCLDAVLDDGQPWRIDPALCSASLLECHAQPDILLASLSHFLCTREVIATLDDTEALQSCDSLASSEWASAQYGEELVAKIGSSVDTLVASVLADSSCDSPHESGPSLRCEALQRLPMAAPLTLQAGTRLITAPHLWTDHGDRLIQLAKSGCLAEIGLSDSSHACQGGCFEIEVMMLTYADYAARCGRGERLVVGDARMEVPHPARHDPTAHERR